MIALDSTPLYSPLVTTPTMDHGRIVEAGPPIELFEAPRTRFVAEFLTEANIVPGRILDVHGDVADVEVAGYVMRLPRRGHAPGTISVAIRPDAIALHPFDDGVGITGRISRCAFVGHAVEYVIETVAGELLAIAPPSDLTLAPGAQVTLALGWRGVALVE